MSDATPPPVPERPSWRWALAAIAVVLWTFVLVAGYFWAHKPFDFAIVSGVGRTLWSIAVWLALTLLGAALGRRVVGSTLSDDGPLARLALTAGVGLGLLSLLLLALGLVGLFHPWAGIMLAALLAALLWRDVRATLADARSLRLPRPERRLYQWFLFYGAASLALTFVLSLAPPTAFDSLTYHLTGPRLYLEAGRVVHPIDIPHLGFPLLGQMQFGLGMMVAGDGPAALLHFGYGLMALAMTVALARRAFGDDAAWYAGAVLLSVPTLFTLMSWPYVDATLLFYATAAFYAFLRWRESYLAQRAETGWLLLLGFMCGFSGSVKYTAVVIPVALGLGIIWMTWRDGWRAPLQRLLPVAALALALVVPYLLENWLTTGNPVYPFFFDNGLFWDEWRAWWYDRPGTGLLATAPWRLPLVPLEVSIAGTEGSEFYEATVGPFLLLSAGLLVFVWRALSRGERAIAGYMLLFFGLNYLLWLNGVARTALLLRARFIFFVFGVVAALGGVALARLGTLRRPQFAVDWLVQVVLVIGLGLILFTKAIEFVNVNPVPAIVGLEDATAYRQRQLGVYELAMATVNELPPDARVEFLWETRSYHCQVECWPDPILDRFLHYTQYDGYDAPALAAHWQQEGYSHVLIWETGLDFVIEQGRDPVTERDLAILAQLRADYLEPVAVWEDAYTLYAVRAGNP